MPLSMEESIEEGRKNSSYTYEQTCKEMKM